jgi:hypothetical protein
MRCPGKNVTAVAWRSMHSSYAVPGVTLNRRLQLDPTGSRVAGAASQPDDPTAKLIARPSGWTSTNRATKSVSAAEEAANGVTQSAPITV